MNTALGAFLRSRRARLTPAAAGLADYGERRRVPGLRREELAQLAGVSAGYYTRLEQGQSRNASPAVLDALAAALRLDPDERAHLHTLARPAPKSRRGNRPERLHPRLRDLVASINLPALVLGRRLDILTWNPLAHALLAGHLDFAASPQSAAPPPAPAQSAPLQATPPRPALPQAVPAQADRGPATPDRPVARRNWARLFFLDPHFRGLFTDWPAKAADTVADLRRLAGLHRGDPALTELITELGAASPEFAALWSGHPVWSCASHTREYRHPLAGILTLSDELLTLPDTEGQRLALFHAEPGSASAVALELLRSRISEAGEVLAV